MFAPHALGIVRGEIPGVDVLNKFGYNADISTSFETVTGEGGLYVFRTAAATMTLSCASANDTALGSHTQSVFVEGLLNDYTLASELVVTDGTSGVTLANQYLRVFRAFAVDQGTHADQTNDGIIYIGTGTITTGKPAVVDASILAGRGQTQLAWMTVPVGFTYYITALDIYTGRAAAADLDVVFRTRLQGQAWRTLKYFPLHQVPASKHQDLPLECPAKSDFEIQAKSSVGTLPVAVEIDMITVDEELFSWGS